MAENGKIKAEFDLPVYDEEDNKLLLVELKWFFKGDGEFDHQKIDQKLKKAILSRKEKQEFVEKNIKRLLLDMFNVEMVEKPEIMSCIVSKNYSGSSFIEDGLPIFDQFLFCETMKQCSFKLSKFFDLIKKDRFIVRGWVGKVKELIDFFSTAGYVGMLFSSATPAFSVFTQ